MREVDLWQIWRMKRHWSGRRRWKSCQRILPILSISHCPTYLDLVACFPILSHLSSAIVSIIIAIFTVAVKGLSCRVFKICPSNEWPWFHYMYRNTLRFDKWLQHSQLIRICNISIVTSCITQVSGRRRKLQLAFCIPIHVPRCGESPGC